MHQVHKGQKDPVFIQSWGVVNCVLQFQTNIKRKSL
jgi:hypothetical protein